jgi:hypothetical protein
MATSPETVTAAMAVLREPRIELVGRQALDDGALRSLLVDHRVERWTTDPDEAGGTAGRDRRAALRQKLRPLAAWPTSNTGSRWGTARF